MRLRTLDLPLEHPETFGRFALVIDQADDMSEEFLATLSRFAEKIGAAGVFAHAGTVDLEPVSLLPPLVVDQSGPLMKLFDAVRSVIVSRLPPVDGTRIA